MNAAGRRLSESRVRENLMHGLRWQEMETETTAPSLDPTPIRPSSGKDTAKTKTIVRWNLKEAGCGKPTNPRANLWYDGQKSHTRLHLRVSLQDKMKSNNYSESTVVDVADISMLDYYLVIRQIKRCLFCQIKTGLSEHLTMV